MNFIAEYITNNNLEELKSLLNKNNLDLKEVKFKVKKVLMKKDIFTFEGVGEYELVKRFKYPLKTKFYWIPLFYGLYFRCDKNMLRFLLENTKDIKYKDENNISFKHLFEYNQNIEHQINSFPIDFIKKSMS